jgi:choline dehydrogenase-like flavoprotein
LTRPRAGPYETGRAQVAELVDALVSGTSGASREGSSPFLGTTDPIVIGSGPGGSALAQRLAPTGKKILILERGDYLPREEANWSPRAVFVDGKYQANETRISKSGDSFSPALRYWVGGNSKVYGAALFRMRDFEEVVHAGGISPAWPLNYDVFAPYCDEAEALFQVHGARGEDPNGPPAGKGAQ